MIPDWLVLVSSIASVVGAVVSIISAINAKNVSSKMSSITNASKSNKTVSQQNDAGPNITFQNGGVVNVTTVTGDHSSGAT